MAMEIEPLTESELDRADAICRVACGAFLGLPDPTTTFGDAEILRSRWRAPNTCLLSAKENGTMLGSSVITRWGSLGVLGPLTVEPAFWDHGVAKALMAGTEAIFDQWEVTHRGLFTFAQSPKHLGLYQRFGYWPRYLTTILTRTLPAARPAASLGPPVRAFSQLEESERRDARQQIREIGGRLLPGLDLTGEMDSLAVQRIGDSLLLYEETRVAGFAICHMGKGSEAGSDLLNVKFATVLPGTGALDRLSALFDGIESFGRVGGASHVDASVNASHRDAHRTLVKRGYRLDFAGVAMQSPDEDGYHRPELVIIDDWR